LTTAASRWARSACNQKNIKILFINRSTSLNKPSWLPRLSIHSKRLWISRCLMLKRRKTMNARVQFNSFCITRIKTPQLNSKCL
jgi:hypothetical protein